MIRLNPILGSCKAYFGIPADFIAFNLNLKTTINIKSNCGIEIDSGSNLYEFLEAKPSLRGVPRVGFIFSNLGTFAI